MDRDAFPQLGVGVGLRRPHYAQVLGARPAMDWFEVITENFMVAGGRPLAVLEAVRSDYPIVLHGVSLSIGSSDPLNRDYLRALARLARRYSPAWISDHLCWTSVGGRNLHDLLPLPYTDEVVAHVASRIREVQDRLERHLVIENVSSYLSYTHSTLGEAEFLGAVAETADCGILLDINNVFVNAFNHRFDARHYLDQIPVERVLQFHLAGHSDRGAYLLDTHDQPIRAEVWELYEYAIRRFGPLPSLIERDDNIPEFSVLQDEAAEARRRRAAAQSRAETTASAHSASPVGS